jgi:hypothetical protein
VKRSGRQRACVGQEGNGKRAIGETFQIIVKTGICQWTWTLQAVSRCCPQGKFYGKGEDDRDLEFSADQVSSAF